MHRALVGKLRMYARRLWALGERREVNQRPLQSGKAGSVPYSRISGPRTNGGFSVGHDLEFYSYARIKKISIPDSFT